MKKSGLEILKKSLAMKIIKQFAEMKEIKRHGYIIKEVKEFG